MRLFKLTSGIIIDGHATPTPTAHTPHNKYVLCPLCFLPLDNKRRRQITGKIIHKMIIK